MSKPLLATRLDFFYERQNELEEAISQLEARLEELPVRSLTRDTSRIGFHSSYREIGSFADETPKWTLKYQNNLGTPLIESALIPAVVNRNGVLEAYGFPKRFRIIGVIGDESRLLFEWKNEFDLGIYPLSFPIRDPNGGAFRWEQLILEVYEGTIEGNSEFFALGEWMGFGTQIADHVNNCAFWFKISTDSGSFNHHPFWKISNLKDGHTSFGLPLGPSIEESLDPFITFEQGPPEQLELHYDVHTKRKLGRIKIYPTVQKRRETILSIGFPTGFTIDVSNKPASFGFQPDTIIKTIEFDQKRPPGQHPFVHNINVKKAQSLRIRFNTLNEVDDVPVLAMSEIEILASGVPAGRLVNSVGFSEEQRRHLPQLSDNLVQQRRLLSEHEWILGLQENGAINREIQQKRGELNRIITARDSFTQKLSLGVLSTVIVGLVGWLAMSKLMKQRSEYKLREELAGDLHDDVGALLGCSMLAASSLENSEISERQKYQVQRIMDSTRQATQAFRDIIWINNREQGTVGHLLQKAHDYLNMFTERYELSFRRNIPSAFMSRRLDRRSLREIYYFIKESINNAHKHAQAQRLSLQIGLESETFTVVIADDGVGFQVEKYEDPSSELTGFGLKSLKRRAFHLKGNLEICSTPNRGTVIQLEFPAKRILV